MLAGIALLSLISILSIEFRAAGFVSLETNKAVHFSVLAGNALLSLLMTWECRGVHFTFACFYIALSVAGYVMTTSATPVVAAYVLCKLLVI